MSKDVFSKYESDVRSYCRKWPVVFTKAKGSIIYDEDGNKYIDFFDGAGALNYGHNPDYIKDKLINYLNDDGIIHSLDMYTKPKEEFIEIFCDKILKPRGLDYKIAFPGPTGTNGIEEAIKLARKVKKRNNVFALMGAFHGMTLGALSLTTEAAARKGGGVALNDCVHIPGPYYMGGFDTIKYLKTVLNDDHSGVEKPCAIILETVQAEGGIYVFDKKFLKDLRKLCDEEDILLIVDDIQVGCFRTGTFFSFERADIVPDIVVLSKSISAYGLPLALVLLKPELDIFTPGEHNGTFRGFQLSMISAKAGIEFIEENDVASKVKENEATISEFLEKEIKPLLKDDMEVRGIGMIWGIDFKDGKISRAVLDECFRNKLIIELAGREDGVLKLMPALVMPNDLLLKGLEIIKEAIIKTIE